VCTAEIKLLISPPTIKSVIASLRFGKEQTSRVYCFDTDNLGLLRQGAIVRIVRIPGALGTDRAVLAEERTDLAVERSVMAAERTLMA